MCVLMGHFIQYSASGKNPSWLWELIYSFHMPLFMVLSGYFVNFSIDIERLKRRFMCLIVPGFLWSVIIVVVLAVLVKYTHFQNPIENQTFLLRIFKQFWFLSCLFFCYVVGAISVKIFRNELVAFMVSTTLLMFFCVEEHLHIAFLYPFLWTGYFLRKNNLLDSVSWQILLANIGIFSVLLIWWSADLTIYSMPIKVYSLDNNSIVFDFQNLMITAYRFCIGLVGSMSVIMLSKLVCDRCCKGGGISASWKSHGCFDLNRPKYHINIHSSEVYIRVCI